MANFQKRFAALIKWTLRAPLLLVLFQYPKLYLDSRFSIDARASYHNNIVFKSFQIGDRFQKLSFSMKSIIIFDRFHVDATSKRKELMKMMSKSIRVDGAL